MLATVSETREAAVAIPSLPRYLVDQSFVNNFMKRSGSRASKVSTDAQDSLENSFPGLPDAKWHEFLEKEETDLFILSLREEIIQKCMEICFESYLEKQAVAFTAHCAYLAWCKVLNVYYMVRDPGNSDDCKEKKSWEPDLEPEPSIVDSWGSQCIKPLEPELPKKAEETDVHVGMLERPTCIESMESCSFMSDLFDVGEGEYFLSPPIFSLSSGSERTLNSASLCFSPASTIKASEAAFVPCGVPPHNQRKKKGEKK